MGIFSDNVVRLYESGIYTFPCGGTSGKAPIVDGGKNWQQYCEILPTEEQVSEWEDKYKDANALGLILGKASGIVAFDFDYAYDPKKIKISEKDFAKELNLIEKQILALLPHSPCKKVGRKGWTAFYKWNAGLENHSSCKRNGVQVFDFLAWHKQSLIPPSLHSIDENGKEIYYKWKGLPLTECLDDLPEIDMNVVLDIGAMFGEAEASQPSRHKRLLDYCLAISAVENSESVLVQKMIERDKVVNNPTYLDDKKHNSSSDPIKNATAWVKRILKWKSSLSSSEVAEKTKRMTHDSWVHFFETAYPNTRKDIVSGKVMIKVSDSDLWEDASGIAGSYRSIANEKKIPISKVADNLERWVREKRDAQLLCDIPKWDGQDRIDAIAGSIMSSYFDRNEIVKIFRHWGSCMFGRVENPKNQNRCIIMKGDQNLGKDSLVKSLLNHFDPYYAQTTLAGTEKDVLEIVAPLLAVHIEEFDQTARLSIPFIKAMITQESANFREAYGRGASKKTMRPSFISTSNADHILRDPTGNRRFIVIPIESIHWGYPTDQSIQCLAQWQFYWNEGQFRSLDKELETKIAMLIGEYTPDDIGPAVVDRYRVLINEMSSTSYGVKKDFTFGEVSEVLAKICREIGISMQRVQQIIKMARFSKKTRTGVRYYALPHEWVETNSDGNVLQS